MTGAAGPLHVMAGGEGVTCTVNEQLPTLPCVSFAAQHKTTTRKKHENKNDKRETDKQTCVNEDRAVVLIRCCECDGVISVDHTAIAACRT